MLQKLMFILMASFCFTTGGFAEGKWLQSDYLALENLNMLHRMEAVSTFYGDRHGQFGGDYTVRLTDGSIWKVHPKDREKFDRWAIGDYVHVGVRTSFYFFKREHKFHLYNHTKNEYVRAMLLDYADTSQYITAIDWHIVGYDYITHWYTDVNGDEYYWVEEVPVWKKILYLSDGSIWDINNDTDLFVVGSKVYLGVNKESGCYSFFLIRGNQREAGWSWARILSY